jgi:cytochrome P450
LGTSGKLTHFSKLPEETHLTILRRAILRDEKLYPNAHEFYPERFMEKVDADTERKRDPRNYVFGFGRRYVEMVA